jgi:serine protease Do
MTRSMQDLPLRPRCLPIRRIVILTFLAAFLAAPLAMAKEKAFLGVTSRNLTGRDVRKLALDSRDGALITQVYDNTAADDAGLRKGDVILRFDGEDVFDDDDLGEMIRDHSAGDDVTLNIIRDGKRMRLEATLGSSGDWRGAFGGLSVFSSGDGNYSYTVGGNWRPQLGVHIMELNSQLAEYFEVEDQRGVLVTRVVRRSPAEEGGLQAGDVIVRVAGDRVVGQGDISDALEGRWGDSVEVEVVRKGSRRELTVELEDRDDRDDG